jgi:hypothetical protein
MSTGYGKDMHCRGKLSTGRLASGRSLLINAIVNRLSTTRGELVGGPEEAVYGVNLAAYVGTVGPATAVKALPSLIESELRKDDRIAAVSAIVTLVDEDSLRVDLQVKAKDAAESFPLTLSVSEVTTKVLGI